MRGGDFLALRPSSLPHVEGVRRAAVLVPLCIVDGVSSVLYTVRSHNVTTHKVRRVGVGVGVGVGANTFHRHHHRRRRCRVKCRSRVATVKKEKRLCTPPHGKQQKNWGFQITATLTS